MTLPEKQLDYWMKELGLYEHCEAVIAAQTHGGIRRALKACGHKVPKIVLTKKLEKSKNTYIDALDDWYPNYRDNKVSVRWYEKTGRVSVWGADDFGMESTTKFSKNEFEKFCASPISQEKCKALKFITC